MIQSFVDRDMFMRFRGSGVGHTSTHAATRLFNHDLDELDITQDSCNTSSDNSDHSTMATGPSSHAFDNEANIDVLDAGHREQDLADTEGVEMEDYGYNGHEEGGNEVEMDELDDAGHGEQDVADAEDIEMEDYGYDGPEELEADGEASDNEFVEGDEADAAQLGRPEGNVDEFDTGFGDL